MKITNYIRATLDRIAEKDGSVVEMIYLENLPLRNIVKYYPWLTL